MARQHTGFEEFPGKHQFDNARQKGVWQYCLLLAAGWAFFGVYFYLRDYSEASFVSFVALLCLWINYICNRNKDITQLTNSHVITNTYLGIHCVGAFSVAFFSPELQAAVFSCAIVISIAYMMFGINTAIAWLIASITMLVMLPVFRYGLPVSFTPAAIFDDTLLKIGIFVVFFLCLYEFEAFFKRRTNDLLELSHKLTEKSNELDVLANTDTLTKLPNRFHFNKKIEREIGNTLNGGKPFALLVLDMDGFKQINDTQGHTVGDAVLVEIANRLQECIGKRAVVARLGGDEFCLLLPNVSGKQEIENIVGDLDKTLSEVYVLPHVRHFLGSSIGIALCPEDTVSAEELLSFADTAMYHAKVNHLPYAFYDPMHTERMVKFGILKEQLSEAQKNQEFFLQYQPQYDTHSGQITGAEALLRWQHAGKTISPGEFIPHLEASHQIVQVTQWVLNTVCEQISQWNSRGIDIKVAVNISVVDFQSAHFIESVYNAVEKHEINANQLELEITEGVFVEDIGALSEKLLRLKEYGVSISIDDFGTGYSSLSYIRKLPLDKLKIDRAFVKDIPESDDGTVASTVIFLAHKLGLTVLAEGVETEEQLSFLRSYNCDQFQGFLASKPISVREFENLIQAEQQGGHANYQLTG